MSTQPTPDDISAVHIVVHWLLEHWHFTLFLIGSAAGSIVWWMRTVFASKENMEKCRVNMVDSYDEKMENYHNENREEHKELRHDVKSILSHLLGKD